MDASSFSRWSSHSEWLVCSWHSGISTGSSGKWCAGWIGAESSRLALSLSSRSTQRSASGQSRACASAALPPAAQPPLTRTVPRVAGAALAARSGARLPQGARHGAPRPRRVRRRAAQCRRRRVSWPRVNTPHSCESWQRREHSIQTARTVYSTRRLRRQRVRQSVHTCWLCPGRDGQPVEPTTRGWL